MVAASPLIILFSVAVYGVVHSLLASLGAKRAARRWLGPAADRFYRLAYNFFAVLSLLPSLALVAWLPDQPLYTIPSPWVIFTSAGQLLAVVALLVGVSQSGLGSFLGVRQLMGETENEPGKLVVTGLYRWVRHPLYTAGLVFIWLIPVMTVNLLALNVGLSLYLVLGALIEERKLVAEFDQAYIHYRAGTPMLIPRPPRGEQ